MLPKKKKGKNKIREKKKVKKTGGIKIKERKTKQKDNNKLSKEQTYFSL